MKQKIKIITDDSTINLVLDTIEKNKQAIVFANTKRSAEKTAEDISKKVKTNNQKLTELTEPPILYFAPNGCNNLLTITRFLLGHFITIRLHIFCNCLFDNLFNIVCISVCISVCIFFILLL